MLNRQNKKEADKEEKTKKQHALQYKQKIYNESKSPVKKRVYQSMQDQVDEMQTN